MRYLEFAPLHERKVDPYALQQRVAKRYGKRSKSIGFWEPVTKSEYIPLSGYNASSTNSFLNAVRKVFGAMGQYDRDPAIKDAATKKINSLYSHEELPIDSLIPTQPVTRHSDPEISKQKIANTEPENVVVIRFKNRNFISDGHHSIMAAKMRGDKNITAKFLDLDNLSPSLKNQ